MTKPKDKLNWPYALVGLLLVAAYFYPTSSKIADNELNTKTITLSRNVEYLKGSTRRSFHRLWTNETKAAFIIEVAGGMAARGKHLDSLKHGDTLTVKYESTSENDLGNGANEIPIYFLQKSDNLYFDTAGYNHSKADYDRRWGWLMLIGGALLALRGLTIINEKTTYILGGIAFAIIIILRILNKF